MDDYYKTYFASGIKQAKALTAKLKSLDASYHQDINPISVFGEMPVNLLCRHNLVDLLKLEFDKEITVVRVQRKSCINAFIKSYGAKQKITVTEHNPCWTRFYVCKELSQMLVYLEENLTITAQDLHTLLVHLINEAASNENPQISADFATYFIAMEFLLPSTIIPKLLKLQSEGFSNRSIAKKMLVPEKIVDFRLSEKGCEMFDNT